MGIEVIQNKGYFFCSWVLHIQKFFDLHCPIRLCSAVCHRYVAFPCQGFKKHKKIAYAIAFILIIITYCSPGSGRAQNAQKRLAKYPLIFAWEVVVPSSYSALKLREPMTAARPWPSDAPNTRLNSVK